MSLTETTSQLFDAIVAGKAAPALELAKTAIDEGAEPGFLIEHCMTPAMEEVGRRFEIGEAFVPELLMAAQAMKKSLELLKPLLGSSAISSGRIILGTVRGDLHDIGKNLVASMLEGCGFEVINLGTDVDSDKFINAVREYSPKILGMSALLTTTMPYMKEVIDALSLAGLRDKVRIMVGGAPVSEDFAKSIGADGYSANANTAVTLARSLV